MGRLVSFDGIASSNMHGRQMYERDVRTYSRGKGEGYNGATKGDIMSIKRSWMSEAHGSTETSLLVARIPIMLWVMMVELAALVMQIAEAEPGIIAFLYSCRSPAPCDALVFPRSGQTSALVVFYDARLADQ